MATTSAASSVLPKTLVKPSQTRTLSSSFSLPSKPFSLVKPLAVLASSCSVSPLVRKARPFELGFVARVVLSDLETEQEEEGFEEGVDDEIMDYGSEDSYEEASEEEENGEEEVAPNEVSPDLKIFVGNLPFSVDSAQLAGVFGEAGNVEMVEVIYDKITGRSRGFGFVTMATTEEAVTAVEQFNGYVLEGRELTVRSGPAPPKNESTPSRGFREPMSNESNRVYVSNLSWGVDSSALETLFSEHGKVLDARVIYDRESGRSRGFGFVTFDTAEDAGNAITSLNGADLDGRMLRVAVAESRRRQF